MAFEKKEWKNRLSEFPNRRRLEPTGIENTYDVVRAEGNVAETGDAFAEDAMNDLEERIAAGLADGAITTAIHTKTGTTHNLTVPTGAKNLTFLATEDIADGDKWTVNGVAVTAVLQNGEPLPGDLFKSGCWVTGVYWDGAKLGFRSGVSSTPSIFGNGSDGDAVISGTVTLPVSVPHQSIVEMQYKSLTINAGGILKCAAHNAGLIIRVKGDCAIHGTIDQSGLAPKTNSQNNYPYPAQLVCGDGGAGGAGGTYASSDAAIGGSEMLKRPYGGGYGGGGGGGGGKRFGVCAKGGGGGNSTGSALDVSNIFVGHSGASWYSAQNYIQAAAGEYGGGGGGGCRSDSAANIGGDGGTSGGTSGHSASSGTGGAGGGGAGNYGGGVVLLFVGGDLTVDGFILCKGNTGGSGGNAYSSADASGGGGGGGGGGGAIYICRRGNYMNTGVLNVSGGTGGVGGTRGSGAGSDGVTGYSGGVGSITVIQRDK